MDRDSVVAKYAEHVLEHGGAPASVYAFSKAIGVEEREFFRAFASFQTLESFIWTQTVLESIAAVESGEEWGGFSAQQKLLTFLYAYCEKILDRRSFFLARFPRLKNGIVPARELNGMKDAFTEWIGKIVEEGTGKAEIASRGIISSTYPQGLFVHFISVVEFNLADDSEAFERSDAYIEKSVRLAFDVIGTQALDSAFDLVRFLSGRSRRGE